MLIYTRLAPHQIMQSSPSIPPLPIPPPPNTAAHFQVPNKGFVGYICLPIPPFLEYRRFFASPKIGGI